MVGKVAVNLSKRNAMKAKGIDKVEAKELSQAPGEVYAAISMALHEMQDEVHDVEETVLTITRVKRSYSPWSSKIYTLRLAKKLRIAIRAGCPIALAKRAICSCSTVYCFSFTSISPLYLLFAKLRTIF